MNPQPLKNSKILIVDDARPPRKVLKKLLSDFGALQIIEAETIKDAVNIVNTEGFSLIFCDHHLPDSTSLGLLSWLKTNPQTPNSKTPFIITSSDLKKEIVLDGRKLGAVNFLVKPFNLGDLSMILSSTFAWNEQTKKFYERN